MFCSADDKSLIIIFLVVSSFDSNRNMESLEMIWVSKANAQQRSGRAGRVMPGVCIHLFTGHRFENHFLHQPIPELHRVPLEQLILRIKTLQLFEGVDVHKVLGIDTSNTVEHPKIFFNSGCVKNRDNKLLHLHLL